MKIKMDINRWRTAADISVLECEPMYAGSMYVHKLFIEANLYENEILQAEFKVGGKSVAQVSLLYKEAVDEQYALYETLIPSKLFKTSKPKQVDVFIGLFKSNNGELSSILVTQSQSFMIEGDGNVFENSMDEEEREQFNENLIHLTGRINEFDEVVKNNEEIVSNIKEKISNFNVGTVTSQASESGAEPQVQAEIVDNDEPNEFKLNLDFKLPRGPQGEAAGFGEITGDAMTLASNASAEVLIETDGPNTAKNLKFHFGIPQGSQGVNGYDGTDGTAIFTTTIDFDKSTTSIPLENINVIRNNGEVIAGDILLTPSGQMFRVIVGGKPVLKPNISVRFFTSIVGQTGSTPDLTVTATVDDTVGTPSVTVTESGTPEAPEINLAFHNLKGEKGEVVGAVASVNGETGNVTITPESIGATADSGIYPDLVSGRLEAISISENTDLNTLIPTRGRQLAVYVCEGAALSNTLVNTPVQNMTSTFYMTALKTWSADNKYYRVIQTLYSNKGDIYNRVIDYTTGDNPIWSSWEKSLQLVDNYISDNIGIRKAAPDFYLRNTNYAYNDDISDSYNSRLMGRDKNDRWIGTFQFQKNPADIRASIGVYDRNNNMRFVNLICPDNENSMPKFVPGSTNIIDLGSSDRKWKDVWANTLVPTLLYSSDSPTTGEFTITNGPFSKYNNLYMIVHDGVYYYGSIMNVILGESWQIYQSVNTQPRISVKLYNDNIFKISTINTVIKRIKVYGF